MKKWMGISLGTLIGISHIGMIWMISRKESFPHLNQPKQVQYIRTNVEIN